MNEQLVSRKVHREDTLTIEEMLGKAGNSSTYQGHLLMTYVLIFLFASFIQMGFPIIFQPARFECPQSIPDPLNENQIIIIENCTEAVACKYGFPIADYPKSVAYTFQLVCEKSRLLNMCFTAFLYGGFIGSLYYGEIIERRGRRYAVLESIIMMTTGLYISLISGNVTIFSIGVFFFNAGFRGFYNASLLTLTEVMNEVSRASTPMILSIGWALGQIIVAIIGFWISSWRIIFILTVVPLTVLLYYAYKRTLQSPRFLTCKHEFKEAKDVITQIALINGNSFSGYELKQELEYRQKLEGIQQIVQGQGSGEVSQRLRHHSYMSLFKFNSIRIRTFIVAYIWTVISLSYYISANSQINSDRSIPFNIALAGVVQIIAYMVSMMTSLNYSRVYVIKRLLIYSGIVHVLYFFIDPKWNYHGFGKFFVMTLNILVRLFMSAGNTFLAIYVIELFPTSIRHYTLGMLGFITKLAYMLSFTFDRFWSERTIHYNFVLGILFFCGYFLTPKLRETKEHQFKDNLSEDNEGTMMTEVKADIF